MRAAGTSGVARKCGDGRLRVDPHLLFNGRCEEAFAFYAQARDARVALLMRFKDLSGIAGPLGEGENMVHADLRIAGALTRRARAGE